VGAGAAVAPDLGAYSTYAVQRWDAREDEADEVLLLN